jgi:hypothetical protein
MSPQDHSKALGIAYGMLSLPFVLIILASPVIIASNVDEYPSPKRNSQMLITISVFCLVFLVILLLLFTARGLMKGKSFARTTALIISALIVWLFPLGTALAVYSWWFLHSEGGKHMYLKN